MATNKSSLAIHVTSPAGKKVCIKPKDEIPAWALKQIDNPYVTKGVDPDAPPSDDDPTDEDGQDDPGGDGTGGPPPKSGKGGGVRAWRAYAAANGVDADGLDVDETIAALEAAGVPVE